MDITRGASLTYELPKGGRLILSRSNGPTVAAERSGDGRRLRIIREYATGYSVIVDRAWGAA